MNLVVIAAFIAVCGAAKLDRTYLPPTSAANAGGSPGSLQAPLTRSSEQGLNTPSLPTGSYTNNFGGVVVDAASPGTRASGDADISGLGEPRPSYGSSNSKVGDAAFRGSLAGFRNTPSFGAASGQIGTHGQVNSASNGQFENHAGQSFLSNGQIDTHAGQFSSNGQVNNGQIGQAEHGFSSNGQAGIKAGQSFLGFDENKSERPQAAKDRNSNILALSNDVNSDSYSYGFETDNGIAVGENGVAVNGVQAEGGYSYQGDDGQVYKVTYTADEGGYRPQGDHLPTPPPIPEEILKSLEQNAKEEAAGLVDDGSYDAQKYNTDGDYTHDNGGNIQYNGAQLSQFGKRPESDATASGTFINQNSQAFGKPVSGQFGTGLNQQNTHLAFNGQSDRVNGNTGSGQFEAGSNTENSFNGQLSQVNRNPGSGQFGAGSQHGHSSYSGQSSQGIGKPGSAQFGISGSETTFNGQPSQEKPGSGQFGIAGSQNTHSTFGQSSQKNGNQFSSNQNGDALSQVSHSSQLLSGNKENPVAGQSFGQITGNQFSSPSAVGQAAFGNQAQFVSQFSQQASASQFENQSPESGSQQFQQGFTAQFGSKPTKPSFGQSADVNSQSAQPQFGSSFKPQGSEAFSGASLNKDQDTQDYGKPSPQTFSGQNFNRPSAGNINSNKPTPEPVQANKFGSAASFNRFPQASGQFGAKNEYLPPLNTNGQPQPEKPLVSAPGFNTNGQEQGKKDKNPDFVAPNGQKPGFASASASTSFGQPAFQLQPVKPLNAFNTQSQSKPNQLTQQNSQFSTQTPAQFNSNSQQFGSIAGQTIPDFGSKPTVVPETELTTPLEPTGTLASSQGSQFSSQTTTSFGSFDSKPASNQAQTQFGFQGNSAFAQQSTSQTLSPNFQTSSLPQSSNFQFGSGSTQSAFQPSVDKKPNNPNEKPQFAQNAFNQNQPNQPSFNQAVDDSYYYNQPSTPFGTTVVRPQGSRFPSSPSYQSNGLASQNQVSNQQSSFQSSTKFPVSPSLAPVAPTSATQFAQAQGYNGITQAAISAFPSASPTPSSQFGTTQNGQFGSKPMFTQQSTFGSQAQISGSNPSFNQQSAFGSQQNKPTFSQQSTFASRPISQFAQKPTSSGSQTQNLIGQTENTSGFSDASSQQQTTMTQQHEGTIYEYNKPAEVLPVPTQVDSSSSQMIQAGVTSNSNPSFVQSQGNQFPNQQNSKPLSQAVEAGSKLDAQNNKPFGFAPSTTQLGQHSQTSIGSQTPQHTGIQFGSHPSKPFNPPSSTNDQFGQSAQSGDQPAKPFGASSISTQFGNNAQLTLDKASSTQQNTQGSQQPFKPFGAANQGVHSFGSNPQFNSQTTQFSQTTQSFGSSQNFQPPRGSGLQSQFNSQTSGNTASGQNSGFLYPENPKPQFQNAEFSKKQFTQNSQSARPQSGLNQFNHNSQNEQNHFGQNSQPSSSPTGTFNQQSSQSQFNSASKPQFGAQSIQYSQNTQAQFGQNIPNSPSQSFGKPQFGQSTASSQAVASGQATASASASSLPQQPYKPFGSKNKNEFGQNQKPKDSQDQSGQVTQQFGTQTIKPFGSNTQEPSEDSSKPYGALNSKPFDTEVSKPLFNSPCCQGSKDSIPAQSTDRPSQASFQGTQSFNAQSFAGKGEEFGGPRQPPRFDDQTGYHY